MNTTDNTTPDVDILGAILPYADTILGILTPDTVRALYDHGARVGIGTDSWLAAIALGNLRDAADELARNHRHPTR